jgi:hypothetical protein
LRVRPVSTWRAVTAAFCTTAPVGSNMLPRILPVICCAEAHAHATTATDNNFPKFVIDFSLGKIDSLSLQNRKETSQPDALDRTKVIELCGCAEPGTIVGK